MRGLWGGLILIWAPWAGAQTVLDVPGSYGTLQAAVDAAVSGDVIVVAPGHYASPTITVASKDLVIRSEKGARETELFVDSPGRCFTLTGTSTGGATPMTIEGFTITHGRALSGDPLVPGSQGESGGAILVEGGGLVLRSCVFQDNLAGDGVLGADGAPGASLTSGGLPGGPGGDGGRGGDGGAIAILPGGTPSTPSVIDSCVFYMNRAGSGGDGGTGGDGGDDLFGLFGPDDPGGAGGAGGDGGRAGLGGAVMHASGARLDVINCSFFQNELGQPGGGGSGGSGGNGSPTGAPGAPGAVGALALAGGIYTSTGDLHVLHCTLVSNADAAVFAVLPLFVPPSTFENSIAYFNGAASTADVPTSIASSFSDIEGGPGGTNIDQDPAFDVGLGLPPLIDLIHHLGPASPCLDAASSPLAAAATEDIDGDPRVLGGAPDMGCDEGFELPGTGEGLALELDIGGVELNATPGVSIFAGDIATTTIRDLSFPGPKFVGSPMLYALQPYPSGPPMGLNPFLPGSVMDPNLPGISLFGFGGGPLGPVILPPSGMVVAFAVPPGMVGTTVRLQGYVVSPAAANGIWAGTNGIDLRIE